MEKLASHQTCIWNTELEGLCPHQSRCNINLVTVATGTIVIIVTLSQLSPTVSWSPTECQVLCMYSFNLHKNPGKLSTISSIYG